MEFHAFTTNGEACRKVGYAPEALSEPGWLCTAHDQLRQENRSGHSL